jgi:hypothetical protein
MIAIYDFEDGLQQILSYAMGVPTVIRYWDRKGFFSEIETFSEKNIVIMSKPYDCLARGVKRDKYKNTDEHGLKDWSRRNWRYSNPEMYEHVNSIIEKMNDVLIVHPDDFLSDELRMKIKNYVDIDLKVSNEKLKEIYNENVNIK